MVLLVADGGAGGAVLGEGELVDGCGVLWVLVVVAGDGSVGDGDLAIALVAVVCFVDGA